MDKKLIGFLTALTLLSLTACKEKQEYESESSADDQTKIVAIDELQFAFELKPMDEHIKMMKKMKIMMKHQDDATHGLLITIIDKKTNDFVRDAEVNIDIEKGSGEKSSVVCEKLEGSGMYHYGTHLRLSENSMFKIKATAKINGKPYKAETEFKL